MASKEIRALRFRAFLMVSITAALCIAVLIYTPFGSITDLELRTWDWRMQATAEAPLHSPVRIITIDQASLDYLAENENLYWPWPRGVYEVVLQFLQRAGAKAVAFDILFTEPSSYGVDDDASFVGALKETLPVVSAMSMREFQTEESTTDIDIFLRRQSMQAPMSALSILPEEAVPAFQGVTLPITQILAHTHAFGDVRGEAGRDGVFRDTRPLSTFRDVPVLSLPYALYSKAYPERWKELQLHLPRTNRQVVRFYGPARTIETHSFANVFISLQNILANKSPAIPLKTFQDSVVLVGMDAPGLLDLRPTPVAPHFPGVEFNASVLNNIIDDSFIYRFSAHESAFISVIPVSCVILGVLYLQGLIQAVSLVAVFIGYWMICFYAADHGLWLPLAIPSLGMIVATLICLTIQYVIEGRQYRYIRNAFRHYVSPAVIDRIVEDPSQLQLGGEKRELTIFFSDIAGFTTVSESLDPETLVNLLNTYLTSVTDIILKSGGTVDKYVGDAVVAFWNAPVSIEDHALRGVSVALEVQEALDLLDTHFQGEYGVSISTRIGLHTGEVSVGNFGSQERFNYTVIGDSANLAARLEGANKFFDTRILISQRTRDLLGDTIPCRKLGSLQVVGKTKGVVVYEPLAKGSPFRDLTVYQTYEEALRNFESGSMLEAETSFRRLPEDSVVCRYLNRIERLKESDEVEFSTLWSMTSK